METRQNHSTDIQNHSCKLKKVGYVVDQFYPQLNFYFPLFWSIVMYDNKFKTKGNKIKSKDNIEPQKIHFQIQTDLCEQDLRYYVT